MDVTKNKLSFLTRPAMRGEEEILYGLVCELAAYEGKDLSSLPLTKENLCRFGFGQAPYFFTEFAVCEDQVVGYALYFFGFSAHLGQPTLYLEDLYVKPPYRQRGIGTELLKKLAIYGSDRNCCRLEWHVFDWNDSAIQFYEKIGAVIRKDLILVRAGGEIFMQILCSEEKEN